MSAPRPGFPKGFLIPWPPSLMPRIGVSSRRVRELRSEGALPDGAAISMISGNA